MVEPAWRTRGGRTAGLLACCAAFLAGPGCSFVPRSRLDECRQWSRNVQAENDRLRDTALNLRAKNEDLNLRAEDDARRIAAQSEAIDRLERATMAYQAERDRYAAEFERLRGQIRTAAESTLTGSIDR